MMGTLCFSLFFFFFTLSRRGPEATKIHTVQSSINTQPIYKENFFSYYFISDVSFWWPISYFLFGKKPSRLNFFYPKRKKKFFLGNSFSINDISYNGRVCSIECISYETRIYDRWKKKAVRPVKNIKAYFEWICTVKPY